ncbi:Ig domain-containing protein, partial [Flavobacterium chuncheonense]
WSSSDVAIATVDASGIITGVSAGTATITYTVLGTGGCVDTSSSLDVTVAVTPTAGTLSGIQGICESDTTLFTSNGDTGGVWSSNNTAVATVDASGLVTGVSAGTATISYTVAGLGSCPDDTATLTVTVTRAPVAGTLSGNQEICEGSGTTFTSSGDAGGVWSSSNGAVATVDATGNITGVGPGTATISYFIAGTGSCPDAL